MSPEAQAGEGSGGYEARLALVCEDAPERQSVIKAALEQIGFAMLAPKGAEDAIERVRRDTYEIVIVDEQYQGASPLDNPVLGAIRTMPMSQRRCAMGMARSAARTGLSSGLVPWYRSSTITIS